MHPTSFTQASEATIPPVGLCASITDYKCKTWASIDRKASSSQHIFHLYPETKSVGYLSFFELIEVASDLFNPTNQKDRAIALAQSSPQLDYNLISSSSESFSINPLEFLSNRRDDLKAKTLNQDYVNKPQFDEYPSIELVRGLAQGTNTIVDPDFVANPSLARLRPQMLQIQVVINALSAVLQQRGEAVIITQESYLQALQSHNLLGFLSEIHHVPKIDDELGRLCFDFSNITDAIPINTETVKSSCKTKYGEIIPPTYAQILSMFYDVTRAFPDELILIHKSDVRRAYHRITWLPTAINIAHASHY